MKLFIGLFAAGWIVVDLLLGDWAATGPGLVTGIAGCTFAATLADRSVTLVIERRAKRARKAARRPPPP
jgi:hypothetical protein